MSTPRYGAIMADPPWSFETYSAKGKGRSPERHYPVLSSAVIAARQLEAAWDGNLLATRLIDGQFPEWRRVVPQRDPEPVAVDLGALGEAVGRVAWAASDDRASAVWLSINGTGSWVAARATEGGHAARATLDVSSPRAISGGWNGRYLRDACEAAGGRASLSVSGQILRLDPDDRPDDRFVVIGLRMAAIERETD